MDKKTNQKEAKGKNFDSPILASHSYDILNSKATCVN